MYRKAGTLITALAFALVFGSSATAEASFDADGGL